jgi:hypothetical protein
LNERPFAYQYHIDYAELYRYETNVIHPPLYAGTCHVSPIGPGDMEGGDFCAHVGGLDHYRKFGYKGKLAVAKAQAQDACNSVHDLEASSINAEELILQDLRSDPAWQTVRYQCNRGILHDGDFAHLSTPIRRIADGKKRVIFGFNCFTEEVGPCCIRAPEHSDAFNR